LKTALAAVFFMSAPRRAWGAFVLTWQAILRDKAALLLFFHFRHHLFVFLSAAL
jgi:hypothetical protein